MFILNSAKQHLHFLIVISQRVKCFGNFILFQVE